MSLSKSIKEYKEKYDLSTREFARICGMSNQGISNIENKVNPPIEESREKIQYVLDNIIPKNVLVTRNMNNDMIGKIFGRLTVVGPSITRLSSGKAMLWICECECGNLTKVKTSNLKLGETTSCGCYQKEIIAQIGRNSAGKKRKRGYK